MNRAAQELSRKKALLIVPAVIVLALTLLIYSLIGQVIRPGALQISVVDAATLSARTPDRLAQTLIARVEGCEDAQVTAVSTSLLEPFLESGHTDARDLPELIFQQLSRNRADLALIGSNWLPVFAERGYLVPLSEAQAALLGEETRKLTAARLPDGQSAYFGAVVDLRPLTESGDVYYLPRSEEADEPDALQKVYLCVVCVRGGGNPEPAQAAMDYFCRNYP